MLKTLKVLSLCWLTVCISLLSACQKELTTPTTPTTPALAEATRVRNEYMSTPPPAVDQKLLRAMAANANVQQTFQATGQIAEEYVAAVRAMPEAARREFKQKQRALLDSHQRPEYLVRTPAQMATFYAEHAERVAQMRRDFPVYFALGERENAELTTVLVKQVAQSGSDRLIEPNACVAGYRACMGGCPGNTGGCADSCWAGIVACLNN